MATDKQRNRYYYNPEMNDELEKIIKKYSIAFLKFSHIKYIVKNYKKRGDGERLADKFKVKKYIIHKIIRDLRLEGIKIPDISITTGLNQTIREVAEELKGKK